jgi:hypothetical protein
MISRINQLEKQLSNTPPSLAVASAELRVLETKLSECESLCSRKVYEERCNSDSVKRYIYISSC